MSMDDIFSQFGDIFGGSPFESFFGGGSRGGPRRGKGADIRIKLKLTFEEIAKGIEKKIKIKRSVVASVYVAAAIAFIAAILVKRFMPTRVI